MLCKVIPDSWAPGALKLLGILSKILKGCAYTIYGLFCCFMALMVIAVCSVAGSTILGVPLPAGSGMVYAVFGWAIWPLAFCVGAAVIVAGFFVLVFILKHLVEMSQACHAELKEKAHRVKGEEDAV